MKPAALTRRSVMAGIAAMPLVSAPAILAGARPAMAQATAAPAIAPYRRFSLGDFAVTTLLAGTRPMDNPQEIFGLNASAEDFAALSQAAFIPSDKSMNFFTPTLVETGSEVILFDAGLSPESITAALSAAGKSPDQISIVVLTHMHGDHIGGLMSGDTPTFTNARYVTGQVEFDHWAAASNENFEAKVRPLAEKMAFIGDGADVAGGITSVAAFGHSPGHMAYHLESNGRHLMLTADTANHFVWSLQRPDWEVRYDMDKSAAAATRKSLLGRIAAEKIPFVGYHMPFPGTGYLEARNEGFQFVPVAYQLDL